MFADGTVQSSHSASSFFRHTCLLGIKSRSWPLYQCTRTGRGRQGTGQGCPSRPVSLDDLDSWVLHIIPPNLSGPPTFACWRKRSGGKWAAPSSSCALRAAGVLASGLVGEGNKAKRAGKATRRGAPAVPQIWIVMETLKLLPPWNMWHGRGADARTMELAVAPGMAQKGRKWFALILPRVR